MVRKTMFLLVVLWTVLAWGMLLRNQPVTVMQPDGEELKLLASGDEYYNYLHDEEGYTVIQDEKSGYYVYAEQGRSGLQSSENIVGRSNPELLGIARGIKISKEEYLERKSRFAVPLRYESRAPNTGTLNNLVVYIRFADQTEFPEPRSEFDPLFNADDGSTESMLSYYQEVSYDELTITSGHYPQTGMDTNLSYQAVETRGYYSPYNMITNPEGYSGFEERAEREQNLLAAAVEYIAAEVPDTLDIDGDDDGLVDNVCFIIRGSNDGWSDLLWAHRWSLYLVEAYINGYRVMDFTFQPQTQVEVKTLNHEMFHALGAPDLYHYNESDYSPAAEWDIMEQGAGHMTAYMKYRYGGWIEELPVISESGTYQLSPLTEAENNVFRINSPNSSHEYFVLEYRKRTAGSYEENLPTEGLLIWRVDDNLSGTGNADGPPDELYVYRPGGTQYGNGNTSQATFNAAYGRTEFNDTTDPAPWLLDGSLGGIYIHQVGDAEEQITFTLNPEEGFFAGTISSEQPDVDYTQGVVTIGTQQLNVDADGGFSGMHFAGEYTAFATLPGHGEESQQIVINGGEVTVADFQMQWLQPAHNLSYDLAEDQLTMSWDFNNYEDPQFMNFVIWIKLGSGINFQQLASVMDDVYQITIVPTLDYYFYVTAEYENGMSIPSDTLEIMANTDADDEAIVPAGIGIRNYPNPFNPETVISYSLPETVNSAELGIYNLKGQLLKTYELPDSSGRIVWNGTDSREREVASGVYFAIVKGGAYSLQTRMLLIK